LPFGPVTVAKAYRLLHAIMTTAVEDGLIRRNPCNIKGAGQEHSDERPVVPISTLVELLDNVPERYRALLLLGTFANLRFGELAGLRRGQLDLDAGEVHVNASTREMDDGRLIDGDPKSRAGTRTVAFPADIVPELADHLERFADPKPNGFVFIGPKGGRLRRSNFRDVWYRARGAVGLSELHFHDLRHTGNTMAAAQGASLKELMERIGHSSPRRAHLPARHPRARPEDSSGHGQTVRSCQEGSEERGAKGRWGRLWWVPQLSEKIMHSRERDGDAQIPGLVIMPYKDVHRAVTFVPPDRSVGAGANPERAPSVPVRLLDVRELPEFVGGGPNVQFPGLALQLDQAGVIDIVTSLDGDVHHGPMLAATTTRDKPKTHPQIHAIELGRVGRIADRHES